MIRILLLICLSLNCFLFSQEKKSLLFVGFDAGETNVWVQVLKGWDDAPDFQILTMATATKIAAEASLNHVVAIESLGISCPANQRLYELTADDLKKIGMLNASIVVTGMYSQPQRQIAELFATKGSAVVAVWDNFSTFDKLPKDLVANVEKIIEFAAVVLVPSKEIAQDLNNRFHVDKAVAFGQPTLDLWEEKLADVDRSKALGRAGFKENIPVLTYISGYEEKGNRYHDSFDLFANSLTALKTPVQLLVQLHPRSDGSYEKAMLEKLSSEFSHFPSFFISNGEKLSTFDSVALADLVICHRSTVAIQALFAGKRCLHVDIPGTPFSHFAIRSGLISQCLSRQEVEAYLLQHSQRSVDIAALYEKSGILPHATGKYRNYLKALAEDLSNEQQFKTNNSNQCLLPNRK